MIKTSKSKAVSPELHILLEAVRFTYFKIVSGEQRAASKYGTQFTVHSALDKNETSYPQRFESSTTGSKAAQPSQSEPHRGEYLNFDVDRLLRLAAIHKLRPVLLAYDKEYRILPPEARQQLEAIHQRQVMRNLKLTQVFLDVSRLLNEHGIPVLPMKGNLLIHTVYGNQQLRETGDVDILLQRSDVIRAVEVLKQLDFRLRPDINPQAHKYQTELVSMMVNSPHQSELPLSRGSEHLDVHWSAAQPYYGLHFSTDEVFERAQPGNFFNANVLLPTPEDALMLTLIHHGGKEHWRSLRHLLDFALMMNSDVDVPRIRDKAKQVGVLKAFDTGCQLLHNFGLFDLNQIDSFSCINDHKLISLIQGTWIKVDETRARSYWTTQFPIRLRSRDTYDGIMNSVKSVALAQIDNNKIKAYPEPFGIRQTVKKAMRLVFKLVTGKEE